MKFLTLIAIIALVWLVGLFAFADRVRNLTPADEPARADAIVALTGPSAERVNVAVRLLRQPDGSIVTATFVYPEMLSEQYLPIVDKNCAP